MGFSLVVRGGSFTVMGDIESMFEEKDLILTVGLSMMYGLYPTRGLMISKDYSMLILLR